MSVSFGNGTTSISTSWNGFKTIVTSKGLLLQYEDDGNVTTIFAFDGQTLAYTCLIWDTVVPDGVINGGYSQAQNDADLADFTTNFKPTANSRLVRTDKFGGQIQTPFEFLAAQNVIPTLKSGLVAAYINTAATAAVAIRSSAYTPGIGNAQRSVKSSSASDATGQTGARTLKITYFDANMAGPKTDTVTLNGTTAVNTNVTDICFIEEMEVVSCGTGLSNAGVITLYSTTAGGGSSMGTLALGENITFWGHHYIQPGVTCYIFGLRTAATAVAGSTYITAQSNPAQSTPIINITGFIRHGGTGALTVDVDWNIPLAITGPALVTLMEKPDSTTASITHAGFDYIQF